MDHDKIKPNPGVLSRLFDSTYFFYGKKEFDFLKISSIPKRIRFLDFFPCVKFNTLSVE